MTEPKRMEINDEIDLKEFILTLWRGKYLIILISVLGIFFSSIYLHGAERSYSVIAIFKPVTEDGGGTNLSGMSGLASLAGISLPTSSGSDIKEYKKLIFSEEVAERVFANTNLIVNLFKSEWNHATKSFEAPRHGELGDFKQKIRSILTGEEKRKYIPPNPKRLSMLMNGSLVISQIKGTSFFSISTDTNKPELMLELISNASQETDTLLKERFFVTAEDTLEFYYKKLVTSRAPEHREALAKLISAEDQQLMLASKSSNFVVEPLTTPSVSLYPTSPKSALTLAIGCVLGVFLGAIVVLIIKAIRTSKG